MAISNPEFSSSIPKKKIHTILAIDDKPDLLTSMQSLLSLYRYQVLTASGGHSAINTIRTNTIDLIILDLKMPDLNGHQVMDYLNQNNIDIPVVVVSGESSFDAVTRALKSGAHDFIRKPYVAEELLNAVKHALQERMLVNENIAMQEQIKHSEHLHRFMVNNSPDIIYILDQHGHITYLNDSTLNLINYEKTELIGKHFSQLTSEDELRKHPYTINERRKGSRKTRNCEIQMKRKVQYSNIEKTGTLSVPFEISSMGIYNEDPITGDSVFAGSYGIARDITARKQAESVIRFQAYHDLLTGLPNRSLLKDRTSLAISQGRRNNHKVAMIFLDLDRFKIVNDSLGHDIGDQLLQAVSRRLQSCLREGDTLSRLGGDEFALLLPNIAEQQDAVSVAEKMLHVLDSAFHVDGHDLHLTGSLGIALYPDHGDDMETLIKNADLAMYSIKGNGKNGLTIYTSEMSKAQLSRISLEHDMHTALEKEEFDVVYQPMINAHTDTLKGFEALVRWHHPTDGILYPKDFLSIAEENGCIIPIGEKVLDRVCSDIKRWNNPTLQISMNISALQVNHHGFVDMLTSYLEHYGIKGSQIELDITENTIMSDHIQSIEKLKQLSDLGITIAIDDFGSGYSSLSHLHSFPINTLKLDKSFIESIDGKPKEACIINAIIAMANGLNMNLIAEGVETEQQYHYLRNLGCHQMQGHLFSEPVSYNMAEYMIRHPESSLSAISLGSDIPILETPQ
ncbi:hypothetical protein A9Q99_27620 [Gammaproteobacteria bacterium 45_16_T64]|nr:hypothetical protein A9Q99_27620 [Gammaproteobacteria bacterium 45_16_T64]